MAERSHLRSVEQLGMDEKRIDDPALIAALEEREKRREHKGEVTKAYQEAHEKALGEIAKLELPEDTAARVGRFRITRTHVAGRSVSFETNPTSRISIGIVDGDAPAPSQEPVSNFRRDPE